MKPLSNWTSQSPGIQLYGSQVSTAGKAIPFARLVTELLGDCGRLADIDTR